MGAKKQEPTFFSSFTGQAHDCERKISATCLDDIKRKMLQTWKWFLVIFTEEEILFQKNKNKTKTRKKKEKDKS